MNNPNPIILTPSEVNFDNVNYSSPTNFPGGKLVYLNYNDEQNEKVPFLIRSPTLDCRTGLKIWKDSNADILLTVPKEHKLTDAFGDCLDSLDSKILLDSKRYCNEWFKKKKCSDDELLNNLNKSLKSNDNNSSNIKLKLLKKDNTWIPEVYNKNRVISTPEKEIIPNCSMDCIIQCYAIHIRKDNNYGIIFRLVQAKVYPPKNIITGKCMIVDSSDEEN